MKKQNPIYLFSSIMSLAVAGFVLFILVSGFGISFYIIAIIFFTGTVVFFMYMANKIINYSFDEKIQKIKECEKCKSVIPRESDFCPSCGTKLQDSVECEYCGHINKTGVVICEECNGLIG